MAGSDSSSEEVIAPKAAPRPQAKLPPGEPDSDDSSEEVAPAKVAVATATVAAKVVDESDSEDEEEVAQKSAEAAKSVATLKSAADEDMEDDDDDEDDKAAKAKAGTVLPLATPAKSSKGKDSDKVGAKEGKKDSGKKSAFKAYLSGLPFKMDVEKLKKSFAECGGILDARIPLNEHGKPRGIGFITFESQAGLNAVLKFDGNAEKFPGRKLAVSKAQVQEFKSNAAKGPAQMVLDKHMMDKMQAAQKAGDFQALASLAEAVAALAKSAAASKGGRSSVEKKPKESPKTKQSPKKKEAQKQPKKEKEPVNELGIKVSNLPFNDLDQKALKKLFKQCGAIKEITVPMKDGRSRGQAFIKFETKDAVEAALALKGTDFSGRPMMVRGQGEKPEKPEKNAAQSPNTAEDSSKKDKKAKRAQEEASAEEEPAKKKKKKAKTEEEE